MTDWPPLLPLDGAARLLDARVPACLVETGERLAPDAEGLVRVNLRLDGGRIAEVTQAPIAGDTPAIDMDGGQVWPGPVDMHTHLDKGHIWPRAANPDGTHAAASRTVGRDRQAHWTAEDVRRRVDFALRCAHAHGTVAVRTHLDSHEPRQLETSWAVFRAERERWAGRIALQGVLMLMLDAYARPGAEAAVRVAAESDGLLGGVVKIRTPLGRAGDELDFCLDRLMALATAHGLDLDLHVDETLDPAAPGLRKVAEAALRNRFAGRIACGHCCNLSTQPESSVAETLRLCREAGIALVTLPLVNLYLQDRDPARAPRQRGLAPVREIAAAGVTVAAASDNTRDPFYAFGDLDLIEVWRELVRLAHLDMPYGDWARAITATPAQLTGLAAGTIRAGAPADLLLFRARGMTELLARPQADRVVLRAGRAIATTLPDFRELDDLVTRPATASSAA